MLFVFDYLCLLFICLQISICTGPYSYYYVLLICLLYTNDMFTHYRTLCVRESNIMIHYTQVDLLFMIAYVYISVPGTLKQT